MAEKRKARRFMRRLKVRFGEKERGLALSQNGLTADISATGMFVSTSASIHPGARVAAEVTIAENKALFYEGVVARQVIVPGELRGVMKAGFGLRFLTGSELIGEVVPSIRDRSQVQVTYASLEVLRDAWERELQRGGALIWSDRAFPLNSIITVEFDLPFANRRLSFEARVVHLLPEQNGRHGLAFTFIDVPVVSTSLRALLE